MSKHNRFDGFTPHELNVLTTALVIEANLDPNEDPTFPAWVETANHLLDEIAKATKNAAA